MEYRTLQKKCYPENFPAEKFSKKIGKAKKNFQILKTFKKNLWEIKKIPEIFLRELLACPMSRKKVKNEKRKITVFR